MFSGGFLLSHNSYIQKFDMKTMIFLKTVKKGVETSKLLNDTKKSISNFCETIPLRTYFFKWFFWSARREDWGRSSDGYTFVYSLHRYR
jgi:hypothetical protein